MRLERSDRCVPDWLLELSPASAAEENLAAFLFLAH